MTHKSHISYLLMWCVIEFRNHVFLFFYWKSGKKITYTMTNIQKSIIGLFICSKKLDEKRSRVTFSDQYEFQTYETIPRCLEWYKSWVCTYSVWNVNRCSLTPRDSWRKLFKIYSTRLAGQWYEGQLQFRPFRCFKSVNCQSSTLDPSNTQLNPSVSDVWTFGCV